MQNTDTQKDFYSIKEFAAKLGVHEQTIRRSIKSGRICALKVGCGDRSTYRIPNSEINRMAEFDLEAIIEKMIEKRMKEKNNE